MSVAHEARAFAQEHGAEVGIRGRLSADTIVTFLKANPKRARQIAAEVGVVVPSRGRLSADALTAIAKVVR